jgi:phosphomannomutase
MKRIFMFDVDGTLTPSRLPMTKEMEDVFVPFCENNRVFLVTGSDMSKIMEQIPEKIRYLVEGIFTCSGNALTVGDDIVYDNSFEPPQGLVETLEAWLEYSSYPVKTGNHLEHRSGMLNYSTVGRNCTQEQRETYEQWDLENGERRILREKILHMWPSLDCAIGGQISLDIYPRGLDKSQSYYRVKQQNRDHAIIFCGDRLSPGGNDYPFFKAMSSDYTKCKPLDLAIPVTGWQETKRFLFNCSKGV